MFGEAMATLTITIPYDGAAYAVWWPGVAILGLSVGFLAGMFGAGGGFLIVPLLHVLFGVPLPIAVGTSLAMIVVTGSVSAWKHGRRGSLNLRLGLFMGGVSALGAEIGGRILARLDEGGAVALRAGHPVPVLDVVIGCLFLFFLGGMALAIWFETSRALAGGADVSDFENPANDRRTRIARRLGGLSLPPRVGFPLPGDERISIWVPFLIALGVGVLTGLLGIGGGFINFPSLVYLVGVPTHVAVGTSAVQIVLAAAWGATGHYFRGNVSLLLFFCLAPTSILGANLGVHAAHGLNPIRLRRVFVFVICLGFLVVFGDLLNKFFFRNTAPTPTAVVTNR